MDLTKTIPITKDIAPALFGVYDENMRLAEDNLGVRISASPEGITVRGDELSVEKCALLIEKLSELLAGGEAIDKPKVRRALDMVLAGQPEEIVRLSKDAVAVTARGKQIKCKTLGQRAYVNAIKSHPLVFSVGPAGTGKTYLAVAMAVTAYKRNEVERIILTRPAIEAGERLGFLPGDLQQKVDPYLRPLYDALSEMFGVESYQKLVERGIIEIAPLAYM
ncbi:MAG: PhoH family protein, partial [Firmicutes bacterium]|nr:PhoH family protein [Bacillota bacterium]